MLLANIHPTGIANCAVDDSDLAMIAVANRVQPVGRGSRGHLDSRRQHLLYISGAHVCLGAYRIIQQPDLDPRSRLGAQNFLEAFRKRVGSPDEILKMDGVLRRFYILHHIRIKLGGVLLNLHTVMLC